jgi:multidrug resistance protein, MATE family
MRHATSHSSTILRLAGPLIVSNLATAGMMTADTLMSGQLGAQALAAVAVGSNYVGLFQLGGLGMLMAMSPTVAHAYGGGRDAAVGTFFRQALWLALAITLVVLVALAAVHPVLRAIGTPPDVAALAAKYVYAVAFGMPGYFAFLALRFSSEGLGWTRPILYVALFALSANVFLNWVFMFGNLGAPALGAVGAGVATASVHWLMLGFMWQYVNRHRRYRRYAPLRGFEWPDRARLREILVLGVPICGSVLAEGGLFSAAALILGTFGATIVAAHAVALNYAALMFMVPLSLHSATTIHVGHLAGAGRRAEARRAGWVGIGMCVGIMAVSALVLVAARAQIAGLYTTDAEVAALATTLLLFAAVFQIADGLQVGAAGALRGFKDATVPMVMNVFSYWVLGFPLAWWLGVGLGHGAPGVWTGLITGLFAAAVLLSVRYRHITRDGSSP